ncbi:hypothetical protein ES708_12655 [subsurface metagenome]
MLAPSTVLADCDVDAADLHLVLNPRIHKRENFTGGSIARIKAGHCNACGKCEELCMFDAVFFDGPGNGSFPKTFRIDPIFCEGCGVCAWFCAENAIEFKPSVNGQWFISDTEYGPMVHARLGIAEENSGKLVTLIRNEARKIAERDKYDTIIVDGSPGIGCPVIASVTGADMILAVTEPTVSGLHDLERVIELAEHFTIPIGVAINKWDINEKMTGDISDKMLSRNIDVLGIVRYDRSITEAMIHGKSVVDYCDSPVVDDIRNLWDRVSNKIDDAGKE